MSSEMFCTTGPAGVFAVGPETPVDLRIAGRGRATASKGTPCSYFLAISFISWSLFVSPWLSIREAVQNRARIVNAKGPQQGDKLRSEVAAYIAPHHSQSAAQWQKETICRILLTISARLLSRSST